MSALALRLAGGTLRMVHSSLIPIFGSRLAILDPHAVGHTVRTGHHALQSTPRGLQASLGNSGASLLQVVNPWIIGFAAYGPFALSMPVGGTITRTGSAKPFFVGITAFYLVAEVINWWYSCRKDCEKPS